MGHSEPLGRKAAAWAVAACVAASIVFAFLGSGALGGTPIQDAAGGWLSADGTPLAPAGGAFSIWSVVYAGLVVYAAVQLLPSRLRSERHRALRPWTAASVVLNAAWIWVAQAGWLAVSVLVMLLLLAVLARIMVLLVARPVGSALDAIVVDGTFGLYLGWVMVATVANVSAWLASLGFAALGLPVPVAAGIVLALALAAGTALAFYTGGRLAPAAAIVWGLAWIGVGRLDGGTVSQPIAWTAGAAAVLMVVATLLARRTPRARTEHSRRLAVMHGTRR
ncbi:tryptophan-rich sensory protein [Arthrobacter sp. KK5.5]|uniref:tryptophan-rich sensory protein n=1 Tax=Arthrobacter sp. KK5.5 TaxID=3373084 RepID=UPI003EE673D4